MKAFLRSRQKGFTFMEIVVVLTIIAFAGLIGYSSWTSYKAHACARFAATQFVSDLRYAREQALVRSTYVLVEFDLDAGYFIYAGPKINPDGSIAEKGMLIKTGELKEKYGPPLTMSPASGKIVFDYRGTRHRASTTTYVIFGTTPGVTKKISVLSTGFSRVE